MFGSLTVWGLGLVGAATVFRFAFTRWISTRMGIRMSPALLEQSQEFMKAMQQADQLAQAGEIGQAMMLLDELCTRPEAEIPALGAQVNFQRARAAALLNRPQVAMESTQRAIEFLREVFAKQRTAGTASALGESLVQLGQLHMAQDNYPAALAVYEEVERINKVGAFRQTVIRTEMDLAKLHLTLDHNEVGAAHAHEAQKLAEKWKLTTLVVEALNYQAIAAAGQGELQQTRRLLEAAEQRMPEDANAALRAQVLTTRFGLEQADENRPAELAAGFQLLRTISQVKVGRGWRQDQANVVAQLTEFEQATLDVGASLALEGDPSATRTYVETLRMLRESDIAQLLRSGLLEKDVALPDFLGTLLSRLSELEDPDSPAPAAAVAPLYEKLEVAASGGFRLMMQGSTRGNKVPSPAHHLIQLRMIEEDDTTVVYGSWEAPGREPTPYRVELPPDAARELREVTGLADRGRPAPAAAKPDEAVRAGTNRWRQSLQYDALTSDSGWTSLATALLPPGLLELLGGVAPNAPDSEIPLVMFATDSLLWNMPWPALKLGDGARLSDRAAVALLPSSSLLGQASAPAGTAGALSYLQGVDETGLNIERAALQAAWPGRCQEVPDPDLLVKSLTYDADYTCLAMSVHGDNRPGLAHSLILDPARGVRLSAGRMMGLRFPRTVVVGACFSGNLDKRVGTDPTGIPSIMLCRGASTVIGGTFPLPDGAANSHSTANILGDVYGHLAQGVPAPWALRRAQQRWRAEHDTTPTGWAGLTAMSNGSY